MSANLGTPRRCQHRYSPDQAASYPLSVSFELKEWLQMQKQARETFDDVIRRLVHLPKREATA